MTVIAPAIFSHTALNTTFWSFSWFLILLIWLSLLMRLSLALSNFIRYRCSIISTRYFQNSENRMAWSLLSSAQSSFFNSNHQIRFFQYWYISIQPWQTSQPYSALTYLPVAPHIAPPIPTTLTSVPMASTTPFPSQILTSPPSDFTILKVANSTLNQMIENAEPLPTPAHKFVRCLTTAAEKLYTRTSILQDRTKNRKPFFLLESNDYQENAR